jgi:hypothetical protein
VDVPWPLEVYGHDGKATNVTMEPGTLQSSTDVLSFQVLALCSHFAGNLPFQFLGDMVLYESHSVIHGRYVHDGRALILAPLRS